MSDSDSSIRDPILFKKVSILNVPEIFIVLNNVYILEYTLNHLNFLKNT
jgi:hypothetical protein